MVWKKIKIAILNNTAKYLGKNYGDKLSKRAKIKSELKKMKLDKKYHDFNKKGLKWTFCTKNDIILSIYPCFEAAAYAALLYI